MDVTKTLAPGSSVSYRVTGLDAAGNPAPIGTPTATVESGTATTGPGPEASSVTITATDDQPSTIRVDANDAVDNSGATLSVRVVLNGSGPANKAVSLVLTEI